MATLLLFLCMLDFVIFDREKTARHAEIEAATGSELELIATFVTEPLLRHDFAVVEQFLLQWGEKQEGVVDLKAITPAGLPLTSYHRNTPAETTLQLTRVVNFDGQHLLDLEIAKDLTPVSRHLREFKSQLLRRSLVVTLAIGLLLWFILKTLAIRPLEKEINRRQETEEELRQAHDLLETRVRERTAELEKVVNDLHDEIVERQLIEKNLKESEARYREIYNAPSDAILILEAESGAILDANRPMLQMYGYPLQEALRLDIGSISSDTPPFTRSEAIKRIANAVQLGPQLFEWLCKTKQGTPFWTEMAIKHTEIMGEKQVIAVVRNIDARKHAEDRIAEERERLAVTLRSIGDGVITTDTDGHIVLINKVAEELTGWSQQEALGLSLTEVFTIVDRKSRKPCENPVERILASGKIIALEDATVLIARNGEERLIADSGAPIRDRKSRNIGVVLAFRDITGQVFMEQELLKIKKLESVGILAGGIAHDFNNILMAIQGNISMISQLIEPADKASALLIEVEKACRRAKGITQQLLTFAKGGEPIKETSSIREVIIDSADFVLHGGKVACRYQLPDDLWLVDIDRGQVSQVVQNLIINAGQAMPDGGVIEINGANVESIADLDILLPRKKKYVRIVISDNGTGMPPEVLEKIFDPYFSTRKEGSGLGLAVTYSIISKHDGHIGVTSEPGRGTTFTIHLPASSRKTVPLPAAVPPRLSPGSAKGRIMVMDDEEMIRTFAQMILGHLGFEVVTARDGAEALDLYRQARGAGEEIDLTILDLTIPGGMGGRETAKELLAINPAAKVVVSSGYSNDPILANFREFGFQAALVKPYELQELIGIIRALMEEPPHPPPTN